jgi:hypothetical protein
MKKVAQKLFLILVCLGGMTLLIPSYSGALPAIKLGEETEVTFYGWIRNNTGMFLQNPQPFSQSSNDLATERTWFRGYTDFKITNELRFWSAIQFAYEPWYDVEKGSTTSSRPTQLDGSTRKDGKEYSEYRNINDIMREVYLEWKPTREHSIKVGRQIAIWGEALTTRVGDVIHPEDQRFSLAFANLEDTRIPSWMARGIHNIPSINSSFEWIYNPNLVQNKYTVNRLATFSSLGSPGQRFAINPEERFDPPNSVTNPALGPPFNIPGVVVGSPFSRDWIQAFPGFWVPLNIPQVREEYPEGWGKYARGGFRTNTTLGAYNFGLSYFHTQEYNPIIKRGDILVPSPAPGIPGTREYILSHPNKDIIGAYMNTQLTGNTPIPGVLRVEGIYVPNQPFNTFDSRDSDAIVRRDYVKYLIAYDLSGFLYFQWKKDAPFDITFEHVGEWIPKNKNLQYVIYSSELQQWNPSFNMRIGTTWRYGQISTEVIGSYMPWGRSGLIMPIVKYNPPWLNQRLSFELRYINVFGKNNFQGLGILRTKDMVVLTSQFNW